MNTNLRSIQTSARCQATVDRGRDQLEECGHPAARLVYGEGCVLYWICQECDARHFISQVEALRKAWGVKSS